MDPPCYNLGQKLSTTTNCSKYAMLKVSTLMWHYCNQKSILIGQVWSTSCAQAFLMDSRSLNFCWTMSLTCLTKFGRRFQIISLSKNLVSTYCLSSSLKLWATSCKRLLRLLITITHFLHLLSMWFSMDTSVITHLGRLIFPWPMPIVFHIEPFSFHDP
jgi:hypothetical protein